MRAMEGEAVTEMVERVARTMAMQADQMEDYWERYVPWAREIIGVMRELTKEMWWCPEMQIPRGGHGEAQPLGVVEGWRLMIAAALGEKPGG